MKSSKFSIWKQSLALFVQHPGALAPLIFLTLCEAGILALWFYAPRAPLSVVLAPPIRAFAGEHFLHYPANFLLLPRLLFFSRAALYLCVGLAAFAMTFKAHYQVLSERSSIRFGGNLNHAV
ncbi:MAG: hypothetical protein NC924_07740, partial [Candidatus Omnitrophica bacterium]|nr:hypothetical protein [Candidatus Omnitrophota bacterium]